MRKTVVHRKSTHQIVTGCSKTGTTNWSWLSKRRITAHACSRPKHEETRKRDHFYYVMTIQWNQLNNSHLWKEIALKHTQDKSTKRGLSKCTN